MIVEVSLATKVDPITIERLLEHDPRLVATLLDSAKSTNKKKAAKRGRR